MEKNQPINSIYLTAIALCAVVLNITSIYYALVYAVVVGMVFLIALSLVSMIDKISDNHIRYILYSLICAVFITLLKIILGYFENPIIVFASESIENAILPTLILGIYPIYFENTYTTKNYFIKIVVMAAVWIVFTALYGTVIEIAGYGAFANLSLGFSGIEFFKLPYGGIFVIATLALIFNIVRRAYIKRKKHYDTLVESYKIIIKELYEKEKITQSIIDEKGGRK